MNNFINATASTLLVAAVAIFFGMPMGPATSPERSPEPPRMVASMSAGNQATSADNALLSEMLSALSAINKKLDQPSAVVSDTVNPRFDPAGSDGVNTTPTWPTPSNTPQPRSVPTTPTAPGTFTPSTTGSGSTGSGPAGYRVISAGNYPGFSNSSPVVVYQDNYSSTGGYSRPMASSSVLTNQAPGLFGRIRARNAAPARPIRSSSGTVCIDGVCYPAN